MSNRLIETLAEFEALASAWQDLPGANTNPLVSHDWFCAAGGNLHPDQRLQVATVWRGRRLVAAAPLVATRRGLAGRLEFIGAAALYEPCNVLSCDDDALAKLGRYLCALRRPILLQRVQTADGLAASLRNTRSGVVVPVLCARCNRVDLRDSWDAYLATRSRECRAGFPRKWKQLAAGGNVTFESLAPGAEDVDSLLVEFMCVEASGWKSAAASAVDALPKMKAFFRDVSRRFAARGELRMSFLRRDGHPVAAALALQYGNRIWELKVGYDERYMASSPGRILLWHMLRDAFARGLQAYEFLGTGDGQQTAWSTSVQDLQTLVFYPYSLGGVAAATIDAGGALVRRVTSPMTRPHE